jgi:DNA-binding transcriptional LysR family regulator
MATFVKVIEKGSFIAAAVELDASPSWITKKIARLESEVGKRLLNRSTHDLSLTEAGELFYQHAVRILHDVERAVDSVHDVGDRLSGTIKVHVTPGTGHRIVMPLIFAFMQEHPELAIDVIVRAEVIDVVQHGLDVSIRSGGATDREARYMSIESRQLRAACYEIVASPAYLARFGRPEHPRDLADHNCLIHANQTSAHEWSFYDADRSYVVPVRGNVISDDWSVIDEAARAGLGIARLVGIYSTAPRADDGLEVLFADAVRADRFIWAFFPYTRPIPRKLDALLTYLEAHLSTS